MIRLLTAGWGIHQIIYALGLELAAGKQLHDFYMKSKSNLKI